MARYDICKYCIHSTMDGLIIDDRFTRTICTITNKPTSYYNSCDCFSPHVKKLKSVLQKAESEVDTLKYKINQIKDAIFDINEIINKINEVK